MTHRAIISDRVIELRGHAFIVHTLKCVDCAREYCVTNIRGYIEGYYGRMLDWDDRLSIVDVLVQQSMHWYLYAPKEDDAHRLHWRQPYGQSWLDAFARFCAGAKDNGIAVAVGISPGLDFDFSHIDGGADYRLLCEKFRQLLSHGASCAVLLLDDIDESFSEHCGDLRSEGVAHAELANRLTASLDCPLWVVPRIYADELIDQSPDYLSDFFSALTATPTLLYSGTHIVSKRLSVDNGYAGHQSNARLLGWDNLYANDYCPRRLFVGSWTGRDRISDVLLNPTGMPATDALLLAVMGASFDVPQQSLSAAWEQVILDHGVPKCFFSIARYFDKPWWSGDAAYVPGSADTEQLDALETLLWTWKTPLAREWYPFLFGLKHDLLIAAGQLPEDRINKTQTIPLAGLLQR